MRALPALVAVVAALVAPLASGGCYTVPALVDAGADHDGPLEGPDASHDGSGGSADSSSDTSTSGSSGGHVDGSPPDAGCAGAILCTCMNTTDCTAGFCGQSTTVGQAILTAAGIAAGEGFCTKPCCSSADCPTGSVCWASGEGGQYCVDPTWIGRSKPAAPPTLEGGSSCSTGSQCNSGLCVNGGCADTCCSFAESATECASPNASCVFGTFPGQGIDSHFAPHCGVRPGNTPTASLCNVNGDCQGGLCYPFGGSLGNECTEPCRNSADCGGSGAYCDWDVLGGSGKDVYAACFPLLLGSGFGASCSSNTQCGSGVCNPTNCSGPCFDDADCSGGPASWHCSPGIQLQFQTAGTYSVLSCGP
jgi:hypothetical protein